MVALIECLGGTVTEIDFTPFLETARLLYEGPWVAERYAAIREFIERQPESLHPVTRRIIEAGGTPRAIDAFASYYRLKSLRRATEACWRRIDVLLTPTAGRCYSMAEVLADPFVPNANLGYYTNFVNLLDLCALAVPAGFQEDGMPFGVTLLAPAFQDAPLLALGGRLQREQGLTLGALGHKRRRPQDEATVPDEAAPGMIRLAVCGAHLSGLPLNHELTGLGGRLVRDDRTAPLYRLYALPGFAPARPGMIRAEPGRAIEVEIWELPAERFGGFVDGIAAPLAIGTLELENGERVKGFICEAYATEGAEDISELGSWRRYLDLAPVTSLR